MMIFKFFKFALLAMVLAGSTLRSDEATPDDTSTDTTTATAIEVTGDVVYEVDEGGFKSVELGQLFGEGDHVITRENAGLHMVLADGSSLALGPSTEITLTKIGAGQEGSQTFLEMLKGTANAIVEKLKKGSIFELKTPNAVAPVKGTQFEVNEDGAASAVSVR